MFFKKKDQNQNLEDYRDITDDVEESDFVPYACHYNPETLITKNGELMQVITVSINEVGEDAPDLRKAIRQAVQSCIPDDSYALWFHTVRRRNPHQSNLEQYNFHAFSKEIQAIWEEQNHNAGQFENEIYITIVKEGQNASLKDIAAFLRGIIPSIEIDNRNKYLDRMYEELNTTANMITNQLQLFNGRKLGVIEENGAFNSEILRFLEKLINLVDRPMPLIDQDLSQYLTEGEVTFGFNAMEVRNTDGRRRFASIIAIKEYKEASLVAIDRFLNAPIEFIVSQCVNYIDPKTALSQYRKQKNFEKISGNSEFYNLTELNMIMGSDHSKSTDFGQQQLLVFIQADSIRQLELYTKKAVNFLGNYGIMTIREDLRLESCYWSQLPANFEFLSRLVPTYTAHAAGFANLDTSPRGAETKTLWGDAVSIFPTTTGRPYHFSFHPDEKDKSGHVMMIGDEESDKILLAHFLLASSMCYNPRIIYFDVHGKSNIFFDTMSAKSLVFHNGGLESLENPVALNPFKMPATNENITFVTRWMSVLIRMGGGSLEDDDMEIIAKSVPHIFSQDLRNLEVCIKHIESLKPALAEKFSAWLPGGDFGFLFSHQEDVFEETISFTHINIANIYENQSIMIPLMAYITHRLNQTFNGTQPTIMAMQEGFGILQNTPVSMNIGAWLDSLTDKNVIAWFLSSDIHAFSTSPMTKDAIKKIKSKIFFPNQIPYIDHRELLEISELDAAYMEAMDSSQNHFMIKQGNVRVVALMNLDKRNIVVKKLFGESYNKMPQKKAG